MNTSCNERLLSKAVIVKPQGMPVFRTGGGGGGSGGGGGGSSEGGSGSGSGRPHRAGDENICASVQSALPYSLAPITSFAAAAAAAADGDGSNDDIRGVDCIGDDSVGINDVIGVDGNDGDGGGAIQLNVLRRPQVQVPFQSISATYPLNPPLNPPTQPILSTHTLNPPFSTPPLNPPSQPTLSPHLINPYVL